VNDLEIKRKRVELARVQVARQELELKIDERLDEIKRLKEHIDIQIKRENELSKQLEK